MLKRLGCGERVSSTVTLGKLFLICQQKAPCLFFSPPFIFSVFQAQSEPRGPLSPSFTWQVLVNLVQKCRRRPAAGLFSDARLSYSYRRGSVDTCERAVCWAFSMIFLHRRCNWRRDGATCGWMNTNIDPKGNVSLWGRLMRIIKPLCFYLYCFCLPSLLESANVQTSSL